MSGHARKSLSASPRWSRCAGSIREEEKYSNTSSFAAIDGTRSHALLDILLTGVVNGKEVDPLGLEIVDADQSQGWIVDSERLKRVMVAVDYVKQRMIALGPNALLFIEQRTDPGNKYGMDDMWGTVDITLIGGDSVLEVIDYKDGRTYVSEYTEQLLGYSDGQIECARLNFVNIKTVVKTIIQPKILNNPIRSVTHTREQNDKMASELADAARLTDNPDAELTPGDHCVWCKHKPNCKARNQIAVDTINNSVEPVKMSNKQLAKANEAISMMESFIDALKLEAVKRINEGQVIPGYELVVGRKKNGVWTDEAAVDMKLRQMTVDGKRLLHADRFVKRLVSPSAILKLKLTAQQRSVIEKFIVNGTGEKRLRKVTQGKLSDEAMFSKRVESSPAASERNDKVVKELDAIFHPKKTIKERTLIMTKKADGFTVAEFRAESSDWTDDVLVQEGMAIWSKT